MIKIIEINSKDLDIEEWITSSNELYGYNFKNELDTYLRKVDFKNFPGIFIKMYKDDICIGRCILSITNTIYGFIIHEGYQYQGYGGILLEYIIDKVKDTKLNISLETINKSMIKLCLNHGFNLHAINGKDQITNLKDWKLTKRFN